MTDSQTTKTSLEPIPPIDLKAQWLSIKSEITAAINAVVESQHFILGPQVQALEEEVAKYCGTRFAVGVASGTDALLLALHAAGVGPGDEVLLPTFSFIATADCVSLLGAVPVFVDIDPSTFAFDAAQLETKITPRTRAIIPVHLYGHPADMDPINSVAQRHNLKVIEDNAQAIGAKYKNRRTGGLGDLGCISFFPSKNLGGYGDGGMIVTNSEDSGRHTARKAAPPRQLGGGPSQQCQLIHSIAKSCSRSCYPRRSPMGRARLSSIYNSGCQSRPSSICPKRAGHRQHRVLSDSYALAARFRPP